jgi:RNA polymerase sigma-70 factor (ECF subfamily)
MESLEYVKEVDYLGYLEEMADRSDVEKIIDKKIDSSRIQQALKKLPEKYKTPVILHYMEGMLYREISATMEIPIGTVMSRLARGRELLKKEIMRLLTSKTNVVELRKAAARE